MVGFSDLVLMDVKESLKLRLNLVKELMADYDPSDPNFEDTYGEGYYDRLWDEAIYINFVLEKFSTAVN